MLKDIPVLCPAACALKPDTVRLSSQVYMERALPRSDLHGLGSCVRGERRCVPGRDSTLGHGCLVLGVLTV